MSLKVISIRRLKCHYAESFFYAQNVLKSWAELRTTLGELIYKCFGLGSVSALCNINLKRKREYRFAVCQ